MARTCIRLTPEMTEKLQKEARELTELSGKTVTLSDLIRACVQEKFPQVSRGARRENLLLSELHDEVKKLRTEVGEMRESMGNLSGAVGGLVDKLTVEFRELSSRQQVKNLEGALIKVLEATRR